MAFKQKKRITFVLPGMLSRVTGGSKIVLEYANRLVDVYEVSVACWRKYGADITENERRMKAKLRLDQLRLGMNPNWFPLDSRVEKYIIGDISDEEVHNSDYIIATSVETARPVAQLARSKGKKLYFIQDFENWNMSDDEVRGTYTLGMTNIVISKWLQGIVGGAGAESILISNPIDSKVFYDNGRGRTSDTVALMYREEPHKGFKDAYEALMLVKEDRPKLKAYIFGTPRNPGYFPSWITYTRNASQSQLRDIYSKSLVYMCASINEGFGLTCLEAMFCGCGLAVTDFIGSREYAIDGVNALVSPVSNPRALAKNTVRMLTDESLLKRLVKGSQDQIRVHDWSAAVDALEKALEKAD